MVQYEKNKKSNQEKQKDIWQNLPDIHYKNSQQIVYSEITSTKLKISTK